MKCASKSSQDPPSPSGWGRLVPASFFTSLYKTLVDEPLRPCKMGLRSAGASADLFTSILPLVCAVSFDFLGCGRLHGRGSAFYKGGSQNGFC